MNEPTKFDLESIIANELRAQIEFDKAKETFRLATLENRLKIGSEMIRVRKEMGLTREAIGSIIGLNRQSIFCCEHPDKVPNPMSVQKQLDTLDSYLTAKRLTGQFASLRTTKGKAGRPKKTPCTDKDPDIMCKDCNCWKRTRANCS